MAEQATPRSSGTLTTDRIVRFTDRCDFCETPTKGSALCARCAQVYEATSAPLIDADEMIVGVARAIATQRCAGPITATDVSDAIPAALAALRVVLDQVRRVIDLLPAMAAEVR